MDEVPFQCSLWVLLALRIKNSHIKKSNLSPMPQNNEKELGREGMMPEDKYQLRERCVYCKWYRKNDQPPTAWGTCKNENANMYLINKATIAELFGCIYWEDILKLREEIK